MLRLFLALNLLLLNLFACQGGFSTCKQKIKDSKSILNNTLQIPVLHKQILIYSKKIPNKKIIKYDPFLSLYLVKDKKLFKYPFRINNKLTLGTACVNSKKITEGRITKHQIGLNTFAKYNEKIKAPSLLLNSCCALEGLVTPQGIIEKEYIERFLNIKKVSYSDIGIRVDNENKKIIVKRINPFIKDNPFKKEDCILTYDGKKVKNASIFMKNVLFSKINSKHTIKIKRLNKIITLKVISHKRYGGGYISDTFLEEKGLYFDENLKLVKIKNEYDKYGLELGDKLLKVNSVNVSTQKELQEHISSFDEKASLLFDRNDFQFFVNIN